MNIKYVHRINGFSQYAKRKRLRFYLTVCQRFLKIPFSLKTRFNVFKHFSDVHYIREWKAMEYRLETGL